MAHAIEIEALAKHYPIGGRRQGYSTLRESLSALGRRRRNGGEGIWALRDLDLAVDEGEALGVIGPNGAGKTTLLKILTRITEPTRGVTRTRGRVGALLEVGTGFHPELTGRENVYLNGAILGMRQREMRRKFDEIVAFAEVERFIDTPVKRYSSGMHMRLAFAVAAHLEPEVLIVDEVLAVGDAAFQKKSLGKMGEIAQTGRTVLFVSHNVAAIESLCDRAIWLREGQVAAEGQADEVIVAYLRQIGLSPTEQKWKHEATAPGNSWVRLRTARVHPLNGAPSDLITTRTPFVLEFEYRNLRPNTRLNLSLHVYNAEGILVFNAVPVNDQVWYGRAYPAGVFRDTCLIPGDLLNDGGYRVELMVVKDQTTVLYKDSNVLDFHVHDAVETPGIYEGKWSGVVRPAVEWRTEFVDLDQA